MRGKGKLKSDKIKTGYERRLKKKKKERKIVLVLLVLLVGLFSSLFLCHSSVLSSLFALTWKRRVHFRESCLPFHFYRVDECLPRANSETLGAQPRLLRLGGTSVVGKSCPWDWSRISNCQFPPSRNRRKLPLCCRKGIGYVGHRARCCKHAKF